MKNAFQRFRDTLSEAPINDQTKKQGLFKYMPANAWIMQAMKRPIPKMLLSEFWHEGELCILFSDTNQGKTILAVQLGNSIANGVRIPGFKLESTKQPVLYFDFELSDKQFENRYSINYQNHYKFSQDFIRVEIDPDAELPDNSSFEDFLFNSLEQSIISSGAKILIIDNITYLKNETEKAKDALPLMKLLKALKTKYGLSILALAHTPKRDQTKPITRNDLSGSKMLINFCDSSFTIGESSADKSLRYIKQIKARNTEIMYDAENVYVCEITKPNNFIQFNFLQFGTERDHLRQISENEKDQLIKQVEDLIHGDPSISHYAIAQQLCTNLDAFDSFKVKINRIAKKIKQNRNI